MAVLWIVGSANCRLLGDSYIYIYISIQVSFEVRNIHYLLTLNNNNCITEIIHLWKLLSLILTTILGMLVCVVARSTHQYIVFISKSLVNSILKWNLSLQVDITIHTSMCWLAPVQLTQGNMLIHDGHVSVMYMISRFPLHSELLVTYECRAS